MASAVVKVIGFSHFLDVPDELLTHGCKPEQNLGSSTARLIECAGRTCYDSYGKGRGSDDYHKHILEVGHGSVLEHSVINFYISGISRGCSHEWVRHRSGCAISQRSTRYVNEAESPWVWHPLIQDYLNEAYLGNDELTASEAHFFEDELDDLVSQAREAYETIVTKLEAVLARQGVDKLAARKQARGAARGALGNSLETSMVFSANVRALRNILEQRASPFADGEIRLLANQVYREARKVCPEYFGDYEEYPASDGIGFCLKTRHRKV